MRCGGIGSERRNGVSVTEGKIRGVEGTETHAFQTGATTGILAEIERLQARVIFLHRLRSQLVFSPPPQWERNDTDQGLGDCHQTWHIELVLAQIEHFERPVPFHYLRDIRYPHLQPNKNTVRVTPKGIS
jgi:hypothetical protein